MVSALEAGCRDCDSITLSRPSVLGPRLGIFTPVAWCITSRGSTWETLPANLPSRSFAACSPNHVRACEGPAGHGRCGDDNRRWRRGGFVEIRNKANRLERSRPPDVTPPISLSKQFLEVTHISIITLPLLGEIGRPQADSSAPAGPRCRKFLQPDALETTHSLPSESNAVQSNGQFEGGRAEPAPGAGSSTYF